MVEVTCSESGIVFEAPTRRTKQHPEIAALKSEGNKNQTYREVNDALAAVRKAGGYETIDEFMTLVREHMTGKIQRRNKAQREQALAEEKAREELKARRQRENALLKANGYQWKVEYVEEEEPQMEWRAPGKYFYLVDPDGHQISKEQALAEIERGRDVVRAEITAKREQQRAVEAEAKAQQAAEDAANDKALAVFDAQVAEIRAVAQQVERFDSLDFEVIATSGVHYSGRYGSYRKHDCIKRGQINGVTCYVTITGTGYDDDGYYQYYSENPEAAGLVIK